MIGDFKKLLDKSGEKPFSTKLPIYDYLKQLNKHKVNPDNSIRLNEPYDNYILIKKNQATICHEPYKKTNVLTSDNIEHIYENFYKGKGSYHFDNSYEFRLTDTAIICHSEQQHREKAKIVNSHDSVVLELGDDLSNEQIEFLKGKHLTGC